jgi:hypothetical protein
LAIAQGGKTDENEPTCTPRYAFVQYKSPPTTLFQSEFVCHNYDSKSGTFQVEVIVFAMDGESMSTMALSTDDILGIKQISMQQFGIPVSDQHLYAIHDQSGLTCDNLELRNFSQLAEILQISGQKHNCEWIVCLT